MILEQVEWCEQVENFIDVIEHISIHDLQGKVYDNRASCYLAKRDGVTCGAVVVGVVDGDLLVHAAAGDAHGVGVFAWERPLMELARAEGCEHVRFRTERAGLVKQAAQNGYRVDHIELVKGVYGQG